MSQQEVRAKLIERIDRADTEGASERLGKRKSMSLIFVPGLGVGVVIENRGLVCMSLQTSGNLLEQR